MYNTKIFYLNFHTVSKKLKSHDLWCLWSANHNLKMKSTTAKTIHNNILQNTTTNRITWLQKNKQKNSSTANRKHNCKKKPKTNDNKKEKHKNKKKTTTTIRWNTTTKLLNSNQVSVQFSFQLLIKKRLCFVIFWLCFFFLQLCSCFVVVFSYLQLCFVVCNCDWHFMATVSISSIIILKCFPNIIYNNTFTYIVCVYYLRYLIIKLRGCSSAPFALIR